MDQMSHELAVEATGLAKSYGKVRALDGVDLRVPRSSVFALLGPNGAGKTTIVRILATLVRADAGTPVWRASMSYATAHVCGAASVPDGYPTRLAARSSRRPGSTFGAGGRSGRSSPD